MYFLSSSAEGVLQTAAAGLQMELAGHFIVTESRRVPAYHNWIWLSNHTSKCSQELATLRKLKKQNLTTLFSFALKADSVRFLTEHFQLLWLGKVVETVKRSRLK